MLCPSLLCRKDCKRFRFGHWADRAPNRSLGGGPAGQAFSTPGWQGIGADTDSASWRLNLQISCATKFGTKFSSISYPQMCKLCFGCFPPTGKEKKTDLQQELELLKATDVILDPHPSQSGSSIKIKSRHWHLNHPSPLLDSWSWYLFLYNGSILTLYPWSLLPFLFSYLEYHIIWRQN